jgi:hypothetical protein
MALHLVPMQYLTSRHCLTSQELGVSHILAVTACGSLRVRRLELEIWERVREKGFLDSCYYKIIKRKNCK